MKKLWIFILPAMMLCACGKKTQDAPAKTDSTTVADTSAQNDQDDDDSDDDSDEDANEPSEDITFVVKELYDKVCQLRSDGSPKYLNDDLITKYCSVSLNDAYDSTRDGLEDCSVIPYNIFIGDQDWSYKSISYNVLSVNKKDDNTAGVVVSVSYNGNNYNVTLTMVNVHGNWLVDNITDPINGSLRDYIKKTHEPVAS